MQLYRKWLPVAACYNTFVLIALSGMNGTTQQSIWHRKTVVLQTYRGKAIHKHVLLILPPRPPHDIRRVGVVMDGFDHHSPILVSQGEVSSAAAEAQPYLCYVVYRLHCISKLRDLAFFVDTSLCVLEAELPCLCSTHRHPQIVSRSFFYETPSQPIINTAVDCGHPPQYSRKK